MKLVQDKHESLGQEADGYAMCYCLTVCSAYHRILHDSE